jgi:hypothetical protein
MQRNLGHRYGFSHLLITISEHPAAITGKDDMLRILAIGLLTTLATPSFATEPSTDNSVVAQEQKPVQQTPKRDCEKKQDEGVS